MSFVVFPESLLILEWHDPTYQTTVTIAPLAHIIIHIKMAGLFFMLSRWRAKCDVPSWPDVKGGEGRWDQVKATAIGPGIN